MLIWFQLRFETFLKLLKLREIIIELVPVKIKNNSIELIICFK